MPFALGVADGGLWWVEGWVGGLGGGGVGLNELL